MQLRRLLALRPVALVLAGNRTLAPVPDVRHTDVIVPASRFTFYAVCMRLRLNPNDIGCASEEPHDIARNANRSRLYRDGTSRPIELSIPRNSRHHSRSIPARVSVAASFLRRHNWEGVRGGLLNCILEVLLSTRTFFNLVLKSHGYIQERMRTDSAFVVSGTDYKSTDYIRELLPDSPLSDKFDQ